MNRRSTHRLGVWLHLAILLMPVAALAGEGTTAAVVGEEGAEPDRDSTYRRDAHGHPYRVEFPLHQRVWADAGVAASLEADENRPGGSFSIGWKFAVEADFPDEEIWWQMRHDALVLEHRTVGESPAGWNTRFTLVGGDYLRHDTSSFVLVPGEVDIRFPAPFDIVVDYEFGSFETRIGAEEGMRWLDVDVMKFSALMDFVRDENFRHRLAIGPTAFYRLPRRPDGWVHAISPMSGGKLLWAWESRDGLFAARTEWGAAYSMVLEPGTEPVSDWTWSARVGAEWTPFAINDLPLSLPVDGRVEGGFDARAPAWGVRASLRLSLPTGY